MSRNLEKEYKELMKEEMPDLWGRIEAGLEPKQTGIKKKNLWRKYGPWGITATAACLCLAVTVPFFLDGNKPELWNGGNAGSTSDFEGIYNEAPSNGISSFDAWDYGDAGAEENLDPAYEAEESMFKIRGQVIEVSEEEGIVVYTVEIEETEEDFEAGEIIVLKDAGMLMEELEVGEVYQFLVDNMAYSENTTEYWIYDAIKK